MYGIVKCFLSCKSDSAQCVHVAFVQSVELCESTLTSGIAFPPEIAPFAQTVCMDFHSINTDFEVDRDIVIFINQIVMKLFHSVDKSITSLLPEQAVL